MNNLNFMRQYKESNKPPQISREQFAQQQQAAEQGNAVSQFELGLMYIYGYGTPQNIQEGVLWFRKAAEQNFVMAQSYLGFIYAFGHEIPKSNQEAAKQHQYRQAAKQGRVVSRESDERKEWKEMEISILNEHRVRYNGQLPKNFGEELIWCQRAAEQGNANAQFELGLICGDGNYVISENYQEAVMWLRKAAEQGHADAQYWLGRDRLEDIPENYQERVMWLRKAAEQGHADAQYWLGSKYEVGLEVPQNYQEAFMWYHKAAEQDNCFAQSELGDMYEKGLGIPQNSQKAVIWYLRSAELDHYAFFSERACVKLMRKLDGKDQ